MSNSPAERRRRSGRPLWLVEGLDIVEQRRGPLLGAVGLVVVVPLLLAIFAPNVIPPTPLVGAAVAVAALLLGLAAALAVDTTDLIVRGPRHVGAAGGELVALLPSEANPGSVRSLALSVLEAREPGSQLLLGIAGAGREAAQTAGWTDALGMALVRSGVSVLRIDLASGRSDAPGLAEVIQGEHRLADVVEIEPGRRLARLGPGRDPIRALRSLPSLPGRLPADLDVLLVALPSATNREVVNASRALDHVLVVAHRDSTSRVQLIAALDALGATGATAQVVLVDDRTLSRLGPEMHQRAARRARDLDLEGSDESDASDASDAGDEADDLDVAARAGSAEPAASPEAVEPMEAAAPAEPEVESPEHAEHEAESAEPEALAGPSEPAAPEDGTADVPPRAGGITGVGGGAVVAAELAARMRGPHEPAQEPEPEQEREPELVAEPELAAETELEADLEHQPGPEPELDRAAEHEPETEFEPDTEPDTGQVAESEPVAVADQETAGAAPTDTPDLDDATEDDAWAHLPPPQLPEDAPTTDPSVAPPHPGFAAPPVAPAPGPFGDWVSRQAARDDAARKAAREAAAREEAARAEAERQEAERAEAERAEAERAEAERQEEERAEVARQEAERAEEERAEAERAEAERAELAREEAAREEETASADAPLEDEVVDQPEPAPEEPTTASEPRDVDILLGAAEASALAITESRSDDDLDPPAGEVQGADERSAMDPVPASMPPPAADLAPSAPTSAESDRTAAPMAGDDTVSAGDDSPSPGDDAASAGDTPSPGDDTSTAGEDDSTDELPAVRRPEPIRPAESEQEDLLRTTAQLAVLMDDLDVRMDDRP